MKLSNWIVTTIVIGLAVVGFGLNVDAMPQYTFTDIGTLGGNTSVVSSINNAGQVVGVSCLGDRQDWYAYLWENGTITNLLTRSARDINNLGQIVGDGTHESRYPYAFLWENGTTTYLETPALPYNSSACAINDLGQVAGIMYDGVTRGNLALWRAGDGDTVDYSRSGVWPDAINDSGQIVGTMQTSVEGYNHAFVWENGVLNDLGTLGGLGSAAHDINNSGQIVGSAQLNGGFGHAVLWENGVITELDIWEGLMSRAMGINESGQIIGMGSSVGSENSYILLWDNGEVYNLNRFINGWELPYIVDINDNGWIIGSGIRPDGEQHGFLLKPVPEPSLFCLFALILPLFRRRVLRC